MGKIGKQRGTRRRAGSVASSRAAFLSSPLTESLEQAMLGPARFSKKMVFFISKISPSFHLAGFKGPQRGFHL